jgi:O-acetyl-ADP-ribose deacetylase
MNRIEIVLGDITELEVDAVVNAANNDLILGSGVAGAIRRKGGPSIQEECNRIGSIEIGDAALTGAGDLKAKWVIHAASMGFGHQTTEESLVKSTLSSLIIASEKKMDSIAFPALGTGVSGFPIGKCAELMIDATFKFLHEHEFPRKVIFCLFDDKSYSTFVQKLQDIEAHSN